MSKKLDRDLYTVIKIITNFLPDDELGRKIEGELTDVLENTRWIPPELRWESWGELMSCLDRNLTGKFETEPVWVKAIQSVCNDTKFILES